MRTAIILLTVFVVLVGSCLAGGISVSQSINKATLPFEDSAVFKVTLQWNGTPSAYRFRQPLDTYFDRLRVSGFISSIASTGSGVDEVTTKTYQYTLVPSSAGLGKIDPITINYVTMPDSAEGELVTEAMTVQIHEPIPVKQKNSNILVWLIIALIAVIVVVIVVVIIIRIRRKSAQPPQKSPIEETLDKLATLKQEAGSDMKKFQTGLYHLLRDFLSAQYLIDVDGIDDDALSATFEGKHIPSQQSDKLVQLIVEARRDKFRPVTSEPGDTIRLETEVRELLSNELLSNELLSKL
ncbi:MAG: hypothetical protein U9N55_09715 [candidate division Zixibacteria bacterium]|nr:hypothetical protein [candidate division Zixibacteria bacterium]